MQEFLRATTARFPQHARFAVTAFSLCFNEGQPNAAHVKVPSWLEKDIFHVAKPGPLPLLTRAQSAQQLSHLLACEKTLRSARSDPHDAADAALANLRDSPEGGLVFNALANIAQALLRLRRHELALCYALAAVRLQVSPSVKPLFRAAFAAAHMSQSMSSLYLLQLVRPSLIAQIKFSVTVAVPCTHIAPA